ncbi:RICIN domain-containing protein [Streptomyces canus]
MARHWQATYAYSVICLASWSGSASMAAAAAFHRVLGRAGDGALRPQLLVAVREFVKEWAADDEIAGVLPELRKTIGGRGLRAARSVTPERRLLAERAFRTLPGASQCLLWHAEVEAEPISVPAGLLGVDTARAAAALEQAREQFRTGCVRAHRELAPTSECRFYNRLLDVPIRRGGGLLPDVRKHLTECRYCRHAAEQLSHFEGGLEVLLAETVLGWGAHRYLDSRPGRVTERPAPAASPSGTARTKPGGRHRPVPAGFLAQPHRSARAVLVGAGLTSLALLATVLVAKGWSEDGGAPTPGATWGAVSGNTVRPSRSEASQDAGSPSTASMSHSVEVGHGRLRSADVGLCLDTRGAQTVAGAKAVLAECSSVGSQQWTYQEDGLLRSAADPGLCLDADAQKRSVVVADCLTRTGEVRYDLTVRGELLLRRGKGLLVAPGKGETVVVTERNGSKGQQWLLESTGESAPGQQGTRSPQNPEPGRSPAGPGQDPVTPHLVPAPPSGPDAPHDPSPGQPSDQRGTPSDQYRTRVAQVDNSDAGPAAPALPAGPVERAGAAVGAVVGTVRTPAAPGTSTPAGLLADAVRNIGG